MSEVTDSTQSADSASRKRCPSADQDEGSEVPNKTAKVTDESNIVPPESCKDSEAESNEKGSDKDPAVVQKTDQSSERAGPPPVNNSKTNNSEANGTEKPQSSDARASAADSKEQEDTKKTVKTAKALRPSSTPRDQSDSAAIAAAEALASLTGGDGEDSQETPCSSDRAKPVKPGNKFKQRVGHHHHHHHHHQSSRGVSKTQAAPADSSTSVHSTDKEDAEELPEAEEEDESMSGSSSTPSSSFPSDNEENDDGECAIVSVKMAPEMRQSVALLAQVQMRLEAMEKKSARLHQRLELKVSRQRRPHLDQRSSIAKTIPGFWVTALLNHPHLSAHIDETDEDALSYMTDLELESFKNNKLGYRIRFHFRRNPYFQNNIIMKELHLGMGAHVSGSPMSFSNPILWHRGQNLTAHSEPRKSSRGVYQTFFSWFSDHSNPGQDDVAQILKDDLYRDPLRYYLTPLWEPRENGSGGSGARSADNGNGDDCVVISDSDDDDEDEAGEEASEAKRGHRKEEDEDEDNDDEEVEEEEDEEEEEEERGPSVDESPEEEEDEQEILIDGTDDSEQEEDEA